MAARVKRILSALVREIRQIRDSKESSRPALGYTNKTISSNQNNDSFLV
jgi:hypothetical protein